MPNESYKPVYAFGAFKTDSTNVFVSAKNNPIKSYQLIITDGENKKVFTSENINQGWNGRFKDKQMPSGTYYAFFHLEGIDKGVKNINMQFMLIR